MFLFFINCLGDLFRKIGKIEDAIECFKKAIKLSPNNIETSFNLGNTYKARRK